jgi:hypothetical protein
MRAFGSIAVLASLLMFPISGKAQLCQCNEVAGWQQSGEPRTFEPDTLFEYMDGNSEGYLLYHFVGMKGITCKSGETTFVIDVSEMQNPEFAYGMFTATRDPRVPTQKIGMAGQITPRRGFFCKDKYYVEIAANPDGDYSVPLKQFLDIMERTISGRTEQPDAFAWFPKEGMVADSLRLVPESVLGLRILKSGYVGQYEFGKAFVVREASTEDAIQTMNKLKERFGQTTPAAIADEGFTATDKYLAGMCIFRKGQFVGGYANLQPGRDAAPDAVRLAGQIK